MPKMRTLNSAIEYFKSQDPGTCITKHFLYTEARAGRLPGVVMAGNKYLVDIDRLENYLSTGVQNSSMDMESNASIYGHLRKVNV